MILYHIETTQHLDTGIVYQLYPTSLITLDEETRQSEKKIREISNEEEPDNVPDQTVAKDHQ